MSDRLSYINYVLVYLLIIISGSHVFSLASEKHLVIIFIVITIVWTVLTNRKTDIRFALYLVLFSGFLLLINLYTNGSLSITSVVGTIIKLMLAYLILKIVGDRFVDTYIYLVSALAAVSLFGYFSDTFHLFDGVISKLPRVGDIGYEGFLYVYRFHAHIDRNNSIFYEPGAYQIFLNAALFMLMFLRTSLTVYSKIFLFILLLITLITTFSTTGYLIFTVILFLFLIKSEEVSVYYKITFVGVGVLIFFGVFHEQFYTVIFEKIDRYLSIQHITDKKDLRSFDLLVDLEIFKRHVFGVGYDNYFNLVSSIGNTHSSHGSSNGVSKTLAVYGLPFSLFLFSSYYLAIRMLLGKGMISIIPFFALLMFFVGQSFYVFTPYCLAIIAAAFIDETHLVARKASFKPITT